VLLYFFMFFLLCFLCLIFKKTNSINIKNRLVNFIAWLCIATSTSALSYEISTNNKVSTTSENSTFIESTHNLLKFSQLSSLDGLSNSNVFGITQDNQGFIWFATEDGLNRFDGKNFVTYRHNTNNKYSIADNMIRKIFIDSEQTLWVGTQNGLSRYNIELDNFDNFTTKANDENSLRDNMIWDIYQNKNESIKSNRAKPLLWISTTKGLHTLNVDVDVDGIEKKLTFQRINIKNYNDKTREIKTIFQDKQQNYWLGSFDNGIHLLSKKLTYIGSLTDQNKYDLSIDAQSLFDIKTIDNQYWLATNNGLYIVDDRYQLVSHLTTNNTQKNTKQHLLSNNIRAIVQFDENHVWLATHNGLNTINLLNDQIESYQNNEQSTSLSENWLMDIYRDSNGTMWLASYGGGVNKYSPLTGLFHHGLTTRKGKNYRVGSFAETSGGIIWLSTDKQGLFKVNKNKSIEQVKIQLKESFRRVLADKKNNLWL